MASNSDESSVTFMKKLVALVDAGKVDDVVSLVQAKRAELETSPSSDEADNESWMFEYDISTLSEFETKKKPKGTTILHLACENGDLSMVKHIVELWDADANADVIRKKNSKLHTPLLSPIEIVTEKMENLTFVFDYLKSSSSKHVKSSTVSRSKSVSSSYTNSASNAFLQAAADGNLNKITEMVQIGHVDINCTNFDKRTACHLAASEGHLHILKFLMEEYPKICAKGSKLCNIMAHDRWGHTPYNDAIRENNSDCADYLRENGGGEDNDIHTLQDTSPETYKALHARGIAEKWAISASDFKMEKYPFARGAGGELFKIKWRGLTCVAKSCAGISANDEQVSIDLANEISMMATLRHPNLVMFLGACFQVTPPLLLMEFCEGGTLEETLVRSMRGDNYNLPLKTRLRYMQELAIGMCFLHCCNPPIVHRDLKPSNVLLSGDDHIKITDFGLSKFIPSKNKTFGDKFAMTGETGSYRFMAPEVFKHEQYNGKVDVYSFALLSYWITTGYRPFSNIIDPVQAVKRAAVESYRPTLVNMEKMPRTAELFEQAWAQDSTQRPDFRYITDVLQTPEIKNEFQKKSWLWR